MSIGLRTKLLAPLAASALLIGLAMVAFGAASQLASALMLGLSILLLGLIALGIELHLLRPLRALKHSAQALLQSRVAASDPLQALPQALASGIEQLLERQRDSDARLAEERARCQGLEQRLRDVEERYALTVERANDGLWEWNVKTGAIDCSLRWKAMLRMPEARIERIEQWKALLHPEERAGVMLRLDNHVAGLTPQFEEEYRLRQGDGSWRWVRSRGVAIRHASGKAYRMVVLDNDIHERRELENTLIAAAEGLSSVSGDDFYRALLLSLSSLLGTRDNLICLCVGDPPTKARTLAYLSHGEFSQPFEYELAGTSCASVIERGEIVYCPTGVCDIWPLEKEFDRDSYIGVPMFDSAGKIIGHFACMDGGPMRQDLPHLALFKIFAVRAAAELERTLMKQKLEGRRAEA
jgi:PAS domain S-box-containing protein